MVLDEVLIEIVFVETVTIVGRVKGLCWRIFLILVLLAGVINLVVVVVVAMSCFGVIITLTMVIVFFVVVVFFRVMRLQMGLLGDMMSLRFILVLHVVSGFRLMIMGMIFCGAMVIVVVVFLRLGLVLVVLGNEKCVTGSRLGQLISLEELPAEFSEGASLLMVFFDPTVDLVEMLGRRRRNSMSQSHRCLDGNEDGCRKPHDEILTLKKSR